MCRNKFYRRGALSVTDNQSVQVLRQVNPLPVPGLAAACGLGLLAAAVGSAQANQVYITNFTKSNNIYTNINEQFPHTGTGTPGSGVGTANASFLFDPSQSAVITAGYAPDYVSGSNKINNGVDFNLTSDANGHDFEEINSTSTLNISTSINDPASVYLMVGAYYGVTCDITFTGADGHTETFSNNTIPDFNGGNAGNNQLFVVHDVGAGGTGNSTTGDTNNYDITELGFALDSTLSQENLTNISISITGGGTGLLYGATATTAAPEPAALSLLAIAGLGILPLIRRRKTI